MEKPLISALTPTYNRANLLKRAIDSVLAQTYENIEYIIVDNHSTDNTEELVKSYNDKRIRYVRLDKNYGHIVSRNRCMELAKGKYLAFCDSDDEWGTDFLTKLLQKFQTSSIPNLGVVYSQFYINNTLTETYTRIKGVGMPTGEIYNDLLSTFTPTGVTNALFKTSIFDKVGLHEPKASGFDDHDILIRISRLYQFDSVEEPLMTRHEHDSGQIAYDISNRFEHINNFLELWGDEIKRVGGKAYYKKYKRDRIISIIVNTLKNPPSFYRDYYFKIIWNLLKIPVYRPRLYIKATIAYIMGPVRFTRKHNKFFLKVQLAQDPA